MGTRIKTIIKAIIALLLAIIASYYFWPTGDDPEVAVILPDISVIKENKSSTFIVPLRDFGSQVQGVMPMPGRLSGCHHPGAHVDFIQTSTLQTVDIIAPLDGVISMVEPCYRYDSHDQYKIHMYYARRGNNKFELELGMEPMAGLLCSDTNNPDPDYYKPFILVEVGQIVSKGQVIGRMVLHPDGKAHIHFNAKYHKYPDVFMCPDIFSDVLIDKIDGSYTGSCLDQTQAFRDIAQGTICYLPGKHESHEEY